METALVPAQSQTKDQSHCAPDAGRGTTMSAVQLEISRLVRHLAHLRAAPPGVLAGGDSEFAIWRMCEALVLDFMTTNPKLAYAALAQTLTSHRSSTADRISWGLNLFLTVLGKMLPSDDTPEWPGSMHKLPTRLPAGVPELLKKRVHMFILEATREWQRWPVYYECDKDQWNAVMAAMRFLEGMLFDGHVSSLELVVGLDRARGGLEVLAVAYSAGDAWRDFVTHLLQSNCRAVLEFAASWGGCDEQARQQVVWCLRRRMHAPRPW